MTLKDVLDLTTSYVSIHITHIITTDKSAKFNFDQDFVEKNYDNIINGWGKCEVTGIKSESADSIRIDIVDYR